MIKILYVSFISIKINNYFMGIGVFDKNGNSFASTWLLIPFASRFEIIYSLF